MNVFQAIGQSMKRPTFSGYGGRGGGFFSGRFPMGGAFDYRAEAGPLWESSIPLMCLKWEQRAVVEAEPCVQRRDENGDWKTAPDHAAMPLLCRPNDDYGMGLLQDAVRFDFHLAGNAYVWKRRSGSGRVVELWWIPAGLMEPRWDESGASFIDCYEYRVDGKSFAIPVGDVIHFRNGIDPRSGGRKGLGTWHAALREVCTDNEASIFTASLLRNMGVPGVIISPKGSEANPGEMSGDQRKSFVADWMERFRGERRGEPFVMGLPIEIQMPGFSPEQMVLDKVRAVPEQRLCGAFGIPASVLQLGTGLENSNTKAGKGDDREQAYESCIIPTLQLLARELTHALLPEFADGGAAGTERISFDLSGVRCLASDEIAADDAASKACGGPFATVNEMRARRGLKPKVGKEYDEVRAPTPTPAAQTTSSTPGAGPDDDPSGGVKFNLGEARNKSGEWAAGGSGTLHAASTDRDGGGGSGASGRASTWKSKMSRAEAEGFSKNSAIKDDLFHGAEADKLERIGNEGVRPELTRENSTMGKGFYLSTNPKDTHKGVVGTFKVNVSNPYVVNYNATADEESEWHDLFDAAEESGSETPLEDVKEQLRTRGHDSYKVIGNMSTSEQNGFWVVAWEREQVVMINS